MSHSEDCQHRVHHPSGCMCDLCQLQRARLYGSVPTVPKAVRQVAAGEAPATSGSNPPPSTKDFNAERFFTAIEKWRQFEVL